MTPEAYNSKNRLELGRAGWDYLLKVGVEEFQRRSGLVVDGKAGPKTRAALVKFLGGENDGAPIPQTREELRRVYADYHYRIKWKKLPNGDRRYKGIDILGSWVRDNIVRVRLSNGVSVRLHRLIAEEFRELFEEAAEVSGYAPRVVQGFVPRHILWKPYTDRGRERKLSLHASGLAVDLDPSKNAMFSPESVLWTEDGLKFVKVFEDRGWIWGGRFRYRKEAGNAQRFGDPMHFQRAGRKC